MSRLTFDPKYSRNYGTEQRAEKEAETFLSEQNIAAKFIVVFQDGRYFPVMCHHVDIAATAMHCVHHRFATLN